MKNSTQITFAFQDPPDQGENPGVGVRIKSLKKGPNEKESTEGTGERMPQANNQPENPADPRLFDETITNQGGEDLTKSEKEDLTHVKQGQLTQSEKGDQTQSEKGDQTPAELEALLQTEVQSKLQSDADLQPQSDAELQLQSDAELQLQSDAKSKNPSETNPQSLLEPPSEANALTESQTRSDEKPQTQSEHDIQTHVVSKVNPNAEHLPESSVKNQVENKTVSQESTNLAEYDNALINAQDQNEEDADLPVFRGSSLSGELSASPENEIKDPVTDSNEIEDREVDEQDNTDSGTEKASKSTRGRKSLKTIDEGTELINIPPDEVLFQKQYYAIGEVAEMFHVNQSLLRFWETEFDIIQPRKNRKGDRHFRPIDIKNLLLIHDLLRRRKLTIEGAKDFLKKNKRSPERFAMIQSLQKIKGFILEIKATL